MLQRVDVLLVEKGLAQSRSHAQQMIEAGRVSHVSGSAPVRVSKSSQKLLDDTVFEVLPDEGDRYVSRGGLKLAGAIAHTGVSLQGATLLDVGMSTGGFTDCARQAGAAKVVGVDVGHSQLAERLRHDPAIVCIEGINARNLTPDMLGDHLPATGFDGIVMDVSFISQTLILPQLPVLLKKGGWILSLVKPQFEVGREGLGKGGIVRDTALYGSVKDKIEQCATQHGLMLNDWFDSPILGGDGNREFFLYASR
ncbi:TlyA family RNA methyltransferase [Leeia oryzae]|uniref:TlyA family RNA methyltransferase n=1 Tax=Leeia oryzae TaxID=356662 RepID=UPI000367382E|nr:TlyA family RNA methyltransferase [Leeia oryzae]